MFCNYYWFNTPLFFRTYLQGYGYIDFTYITIITHLEEL